jgi:basic amino acid/polyamine antiporter, APA family
MTGQRKLVRALGLASVVIFVIANIVGSGVYKKVAPMAADLQSSGWILIAFLTGGVITLMGALCNAEVAGLLADTGGDLVYLKKIYNRFFAFIYGWALFTVIQTATISSLANVFAQSFDNLIPLPDVLSGLKDYTIGGVFFPFKDFGIKIVAIVAIMILTFINMAGLKSGAGLGRVLFIIVFSGLILIIIFGLTSPSATSLAKINANSAPSHPVTLSLFYSALLGAFWAYQGWGSVGFIGGEVKNPTKNIPRGIIIGTILIIVVYLLVNATYLSLLSIRDLTEISNSGNKIAAVEAARIFWGNGGVMFLSILILITTAGCINASILTGARPYYAMSKDKLFFSGIGKLNNRNVPANSLLWQGIWASVLVLSGTFDQLTDMVIFTVFIFYGATALGVIILRKRMPDAYRPYKVWGYPVIPVLYVLFCIGLFINTFISKPREAIIGIVLVLTGIPVYFLLKWKNQAKA